MDDLLALGNILVCFFRQGELPWDMVPLPELIVDDKDPLIYKKTMKYEADLRNWDAKFLEKKLAVSYQSLTEGMPS